MRHIQAASLSPDEWGLQEEKPMSGTAGESWHGFKSREENVTEDKKLL